MNNNLADQPKPELLVSLGASRDTSMLLMALERGLLLLALWLIVWSAQRRRILVRI